jgi:hypothetical protein
MHGADRNAGTDGENEIVVLLRRLVDAQEKMLRLFEEQAAARAPRRSPKPGPAPVIDEVTARRAQAELTKRGLGRVQPLRKR